MFRLIGLLIPLVLWSCGSDTGSAPITAPSPQEIAKDFDIFQVSAQFLNDNNLDKQVLITNQKENKDEKLLIVFGKIDRKILVKEGNQFKQKMEKIKLPDGSGIEAPLYKSLFNIEWLTYSKQTLKIQNSNCAKENLDECQVTKYFDFLMANNILQNKESDYDQVTVEKDFPWNDGAGELAFGTYISTERFDPVDYGPDEEKVYFETFQACKCSPKALAPFEKLSFAKFISAESKLIDRFLYQVQFKGSNTNFNKDQYFVDYQVRTNKDELDNYRAEINVEEIVPAKNFMRTDFMESFPNGRHYKATLYKMGKENTLYPVGNLIHSYLDHYKLDPENDFEIDVRYEKLNDHFHTRRYKITASLKVNIPRVYPLDFNLVYNFSSPGVSGSYIFSDGIIRDHQTMTAELREDVLEDSIFNFYVKSFNSRSFYLSPAGRQIFMNKDDRDFHLKRTIKTPIVHVKPSHLKLECRVQNNQLIIDLNSKSSNDFQVELIDMSGNDDVVTQSSWQTGDNLSFTFDGVPTIFNFKVNYNNSHLNEVKSVRRSSSRHRFWPADCNFPQR
jgi:hypothetical protein